VAAGVGGIGLIGVVIALVVSSLGGGGGGVEDILGQLQGGPPPQQQEIDTSEFAGEDDYEVFAATVLGSNNELWAEVFTANGLQYTEPTLVLFRQATPSACGGANSRIGPHYCPLDETIYLDETFFAELQQRFGAAGGDVAEAYVIAHEVAHHVQNELNITDEVQRQQRSAAQTEANALSVQVELQADCFAGVWANSIRDAGVFLPGEINEAIDAAAAVGDDRIQETMQGRVNPESWTHGSSQQRVDWFNRGYDSGDPGRCDTFG
jgi:predicted metalloprotease